MPVILIRERPSRGRGNVEHEIGVGRSACPQRRLGASAFFCSMLVLCADSPKKRRLRPGRPGQKQALGEPWFRGPEYSSKKVDLRLPLPGQVDTGKFVGFGHNRGMRRLNRTANASGRRFRAVSSDQVSARPHTRNPPGHGPCGKKYAFRTKCDRRQNRSLPQFPLAHRGPANPDRGKCSARPSSGTAG